MHQFKKYLFSPLFFLIISTNAFGQLADLAKWEALFLQPFDPLNKPLAMLWDSISRMPAQQTVAIIAGLEEQNHKDEDKIKILLLKLRYARLYDGHYKDANWKYMGSQALSQCTIAGNTVLLQVCCEILGDSYLRANNNDTAVFYLLKAIGLAEQLNYKEEVIANDKISASNALYHLQQYRACITFCGSTGYNEKKYLPITVITAYNNTGLSFLNLAQPDSALLYFKKGYAYCQQQKWGVWAGIMLGNMGDALYEKNKAAEAVPYWQHDYDTCVKYGDLQNAGLSLAYISRFQFTQGMQQTAMHQLHWAQAINANNSANLHRIFAIKADCYKQLGLLDSAWYFLQQHFKITDSINRVVNSNNFNAVQLKLVFEKNLHDLSQLKTEKQTALMKRNLLMLALLVLAVLGWLLYNRQQLKVKLARQQLASAEAETVAAKEQLLIFTQTLLQKNEVIEQLHTSLQQQVQISTDELIHLTLLTDYDWNRFKELFEKIYPDFFAGLKSLSPNITQAELRLAALIKLNLDNKQMASMQGISVSSLRGNKTRLRQKLNLQPETELEDFIRQL
jgi:DNA-binding CsgD family transcriptional regulator